MTSAILTLMVEMAFHNANVILFINDFFNGCLEINWNPLTLSTDLERSHLSVA